MRRHTCDRPGSGARVSRRPTKNALSGCPVSPAAAEIGASVGIRAVHKPKKDRVHLLQYDIRSPDDRCRNDVYARCAVSARSGRTRPFASSQLLLGIAPAARAPPKKS